MALTAWGRICADPHVTLQTEDEICVRADLLQRLGIAAASLIDLNATTSDQSGVTAISQDAMQITMSPHDGFGVTAQEFAGMVVQAVQQLDLSTEIAETILSVVAEEFADISAAVAAIMEMAATAYDENELNTMAEVDDIIVTPPEDCD